jgi:hypothetical protein
MSEQNELSFAASISTDEFDAGIEHITASVNNVAADCESQSAKIQSLINSAVPEVDISFLTNAVPTLNGIGEAYANIAKVVRENESAINELSNEYNRLTEECNKYANVPSKHDDVIAMRAQRDAIKENITVRRKVIEKAKEQETALQKEEKTLIAAANAAIKDSAAKEKSATSTMSLKQRIKELEAEAAMLVDTYQREGKQLDQSQGRYREIIEELGRLRDIRGDIQTAGSVFANDESHFAGVISGFSGVAGAMSAAQGAVGLFAGENERLNEIMLKVQSLMAITVGLQQLSQTLNKDSAFTLVTLNSVKQIWNKLTGESNDILETENELIEDNTDDLREDVAATETHEAVEQADAAATQKNATATETNSAAQTGNVTATESATAATAAHTGAMTASTVATTALSAAMRVLKLALISTGIGALIVLVGELVSWIVDLCTTEDDAVKHTQDLNKINEDAAKTYIQEKVALDDNINACKNFTGTKEQERKKVDELNSKYGDALGYYDSLAEWESVLEKRGPAYCEMLRMKAAQQGLLNKYVEAYVESLAIANKAENGEFDRGWYNPARWFGESNEERKERIKKEAEEEVKYWEEQMNVQKAALEKYQRENNFDVVHIDPKSKTASGSGSGKTFDAEKAARDQQTAIQQYQDKVSKYIKDANAQLSQDMINGLADGLGKEITNIRYNGQQRIDAWRNALTQLATERKQMLHDAYMTQQGATENGWAQSDDGQKSVDDFVAEILGVQIDDVETALSSQLTDVGKKAQEMIISINDSIARQIADARQKSLDSFIDSYGTDEQKIEQVMRQYTQALNSIPAEISGDAYDEVFDNINRAFETKLANIDIDKFKDSIQWDVVFGNLDEQSLPSIELALQKVKQYFKQASNEMSAEQIKTFQDAISSMENEIASRNPFTALHKSFADIAASKTELTAALVEYKTAQDELTAAQTEYNDALREQNELTEQLESMDEGSEQYAATAAALESATGRVTNAKTRLTKAHKNEQSASNRVVNANNQVTKSYKQFATNLKSCGAVVTDLGGKASKLARIFSDDIADSMDKALSFIDDVLDATSDVISAIGDLGKSVAKDAADTVDAVGESTKQTAQATATAISTVEKASVILTVISAALQIATAIANLFNNDDAKEKQIEKLQRQIDELQWELDNADAVRLQQNNANALQKLREIYASVTAEVIKAHTATERTSIWAQYFYKAKYSAEIYSKTIEKIADYWASVSYSSDKALGSAKYDESRKQLENLAEQQMLVYKQMNEENSKKKTDDDKIQEYQQQIAELAEEMATIINDMMEDIIGTTAEDLASTLGDAFFEAVAAGEDAMEAWADSTNELVADIIKRMMITQYLEPEIGKIFDKYKTSWFGTDGKFKGIQAVIDSADNMANDINQVGEEFSAVWDGLSSSLGKWFDDDSSRESSSKGIATASQDSVDENNARLTTIQGHTYTLVQGVNELNTTANAMLDRLTGIERNTDAANDKLDTVNAHIKVVRNVVEDMQTHGLKIK